MPNELLRDEPTLQKQTIIYGGAESFQNAIWRVFGRGPSLCVAASGYRGIAPRPREIEAAIAKGLVGPTNRKMRETLRSSG